MTHEANDWSPGAVIDGFTLGARVGAGGMGALFRVTKPGIERPLIMKLPRLGPDEPGETIVGFETEAMILPTLKGPHVPAFVAAGDLAGTPYLVTEWIEGRTLEDLLGAGPLGAADVARIGAALADALHAVHQQGVIHLDVKPGNAILRADGTVVLIDLGFAHHAQYPDLLAEETRFRAGSAPYVSPEQLLGTRSDRRSDLFALGVVLYELATGELPFGEPDTDVRNRLWLDPAPPSAIAPGTPPWLQEIILRSLEPRAELRYQSAAHVAFDLRHPEQVALSARATKARRAGLVAQLRRFLRARAEHGARLRAPPALLSGTPTVLVAVDTAHLEDERHQAIRLAVSQVLALSTEFRLICLTVIAHSEASREHLVKLRGWAAPLGLASQRLSLHAVASSAPEDVIVELAHHNHVDLVVVGAPPQGGRAWSQSVASTVTARARCSVHVVRVNAARG
ncbi:bifunctional serine/threonine-protein kinase/universal stress protein [Sorangium sp. So ce119]|uniref:protein kinase domain-containing protein n=1 Tax=Sorangium sp. So ce119 TaxID=3133279 RepID=UPI003F62897D